MNFSIAATTSRLLAPRHELSCSWLLWVCLIARLRERGRERDPRERRISSRLPKSRAARAHRRLRPLRRSRSAQPRHRHHPFRRQAFRQALGDLPLTRRDHRGRRPCSSRRIGTKRIRPSASHGHAGGPSWVDLARFRAPAGAARGHRHLPLSGRPSLAHRSARAAPDLFSHRTLRTAMNAYTSADTTAPPRQAGDGQWNRAQPRGSGGNVTRIQDRAQRGRRHRHRPA